MDNYLFYIDDSGTKEYAPLGVDYSSNNTRYFVFGGMLIDEKLNGAFVKRIKDTKVSFFQTEDVEIKSHWLRRQDKRKEKYIGKYGISESKLMDFTEAIYSIINESEIMLIAAVVDKKQMKETYNGVAWYAPAVAYDVLMQRVVQEVFPPNKVIVTIDDMTGATPKGNQYKQNLIRHHEQLKKTGSRLRSSLSFSSLHGRLRFVNSAISENVQIADIVSYNVFRQFTDHGKEWDSLPDDFNDGESLTLPTYEYLERISVKFRDDGNGRIQGYGIVKFPLIKRIPWCFEKK